MTTVSITGNVATHTETGKTYTYGKRGRKPAWLIAYELQHGVPEYDKKIVEKVKVDLADCEVTFDAESKTITNHTINKTYTIGQRGKRAAWVVEWLSANAEMLNDSLVEETVEV